MPRFFVYGTLMPGHAPTCVADLVGRFVPLGRATVPGSLYDLGDYPGLMLHSGASPDERVGDGSTSPAVFGVLVDVPDDPALVRRLDAYEGFDPAAPGRSLFCRVPAVARLLADGGAVDCQTYVYNRVPPPGRVVAGGDWLRRGTPAITSATEPPAGRPTAEPSGGQTARTQRPMRKRPIIGITTDYVDEKPTRYMLPSDYAASVERAGGLPVLLPFRSDLSLIPDYVDLVDGIVFTGGNDLDPALYGDEPIHPMARQLDPARQRFELALIAEVERRRTPALGVCLGSQLMNVHRGGTLTQFIPDLLPDSPIEHRYRGDDGFRHEVTVAPGTVLADVVGRAGSITVNSRHKQAVHQLGRGLRANAVAPDGVVEGFEDPSLPLFLAVQWHPENLSAAHPEHLAPFARLVKTSAATRA
jgi:putative glutamine amidotransferase